MWGHYKLAKDWCVTQEYREQTMAKKRESNDKKVSEKTRGS
jgi:hypothetical protein